MSILNQIVKDAVNKKCAPSDEAIAKVKAWAHQQGPLYFEDFLVAAAPRDCIILMVINKDGDVDTEEKVEKFNLRVKRFIDIVLESLPLPDKITMGFVLRIFDPKGPSVDYKTVTIKDNKVEAIDCEESLILSDLVLTMDSASCLSILRAKLHPSGIRMAWGKSRTHKLITKLEEHGLTEDDKISKFAEKIGVTVSYMQDLMMGYHHAIPADIYQLIASELDVTPEALGFVKRED